MSWPGLKVQFYVENKQKQVEDWMGEIITTLFRLQHTHMLYSLDVLVLKNVMKN